MDGFFEILISQLCSGGSLKRIRLCNVVVGSQKNLTAVCVKQRITYDSGIVGSYWISMMMTENRSGALIPRKFREDKDECLRVDCVKIFTSLYSIPNYTYK